MNTSARNTVVVLDDWEHALRERVRWDEIRTRAEVTIHSRRLVGGELVEALQGAQCVVLFRDRTPMPRALLETLPDLRHIVYTGTRNRTLDIEAAQSLGMSVSHTEWGPSKASTCEMTWTLILAAVRRLPSIQLTPSRPVWRAPHGASFLPPVLEGKRLGLIGLGQIGQRVAAVGQVLGMEVVTWSPNMTAARAAASGVTAVSLEELLGTAQVVSLHLVPSASTHHLLNAERLGAMRPDSVLVNTSRAELVDSQALVHALQAGRPGLAALDVFAHEPLDAASPLLALENVILTPHYGFLSREVVEEFARGVEGRLMAVLGEGPSGAG